MEKRLYKDELNKKIGGVCAGLAEYLNIDVTIIRVIFVLGLFLKGAVVLPYIVLMVILPKKPYGLTNPNVDYTVPPQNDSFNPFTAAGTPPPPFAMQPKKSSSAGLIAGIALVLFGSFFLLDEFNIFPALDFGQLWPVILIIAGVVIIFSGRETKPVFDETQWQANPKKEDAPLADDITNNTTDNPSTDKTE